MAMMSKRKRPLIVLLFALCGLMSGLCWSAAFHYLGAINNPTFLAHPSPALLPIIIYVWWFAGATLLIGFTAAFEFCRWVGWIVLRPSARQFGIFASLILLAFPCGEIVGGYVGGLLSLRFNYFFLAPVYLAVGVGTVAFVLSRALQMLTEIRSRVMLRYMLGLAVLLVGATLLLFPGLTGRSTTSSPHAMYFLQIAGQALAGGCFGYWMSVATDKAIGNRFAQA
jgi:MFS family permease